MAQNAANSAITTLTVLALIVSAYHLSHVVAILLLFFAGAVLAVLLDAITTTAQRFLPGGRAVGLLAMAVTVALVVAFVGLLVVPRVVAQVPDLVQSLPDAWSMVRQRLQQHGLLQPLLRQVAAPSQLLQGSGLLGRITGVISNTFDFIFNIVVIAFIGIYLTVSPAMYWQVALAPLRPQRQREGRALFAEVGRELRHWLAGRAVSMVTVGVATGLGLWLLGVRLAFTLGLLAGMFSFVPYLGPIVALVPALLIAFSQSPALAGMAALLYVGIQTLESYVITPVVQQRASAIPPALLLTAQILGGVFGGVLGVIFAAPLGIAGATAFRRIYIEPRNQEAVDAS